MKYESELETSLQAEQRQKTEEFSIWTVKAMGLLRKLRAWLTKIHRTWAAFNARDGDQCYFTDIRDPDSDIAFESLKRSFRGFEELHHTILELDKACKESKEIVS